MYMAKKTNQRTKKKKMGERISEDWLKHRMQPPPPISNQMGLGWGGCAFLMGSGDTDAVENHGSRRGTESQDVGDRRVGGPEVLGWESMSRIWLRRCFR